MVPDAFYIGFFGWEAEVGVGLSSCDDGVFALGVEAYGFAHVSEALILDPLEDAVGVGHVGV